VRHQSLQLQQPDRHRLARAARIHHRSEFPRLVEDGSALEIADLCERQDATLTAARGSWRVQKSWSNAQQACVFGPASGDKSVFVSQPAQGQVTAGTTFSNSVTFQNTGGTTWTAGAGYYLAALGTTWGTNSVGLGAIAVSPGASRSFAYSLTAPSTPGSYTLQWQLERGATAFGEASPIQTIRVVPNAASLPKATWSLRGVAQAASASVTWSSPSDIIGYTSQNATRCDLTKNQSLSPFTPSYSLVENDPNHGLSDANVTVLTTPAKYRYDVTCYDPYGDSKVTSLYLTVTSSCTASARRAPPAPRRAATAARAPTPAPPLASGWPGTCTSQGVCAPGSTASCCPCGSTGCGCQGDQVCNLDCTWSSCREFVCKPGLCR